MADDFLKSKPAKVEDGRVGSSQELREKGGAQERSGWKLLKKPALRLFEPREPIKIIPHQ